MTSQRGEQSGKGGLIEGRGLEKLPVGEHLGREARATMRPCARTAKVSSYPAILARVVGDEHDVRPMRRCPPEFWRPGRRGRAVQPRRRIHTSRWLEGEDAGKGDLAPLAAAEV